MRDDTKAAWRQLREELEEVKVELARYKAAVHYLRRNIDGYDVSFECCGVDDFKEEP